MFSKIVRTPALQGDPVIIETFGKKKPPPVEEEPNDNDAADSSDDDKPEGDGGSGLDEETINTMLAEIAAKEQHAIQMLKDAKVQAEILKQEAANESKKILDEAKAEADKLRDDAKKKGRAEGLKEGKKDGHDEGVKAAKKEFADKLNEANQRAEKTLQDAKAATADYFVRAEKDIANIVMLSIEKILPQHFLDVPQVVLPVVREAIKKVRDQKEIKIHVAPNNYDIVLVARAEFQSMLTDGTAVIEVVSDEALKEGDCVIETPNGGVDARLLTQIELMKNAIQSVL